MPWDQRDKRRIVDPETFADARRQSARMMEEAKEMVERALEIDLSVVATLISLSADWYRRGNQEKGHRAKAEALKGVETIRHFLSSTNFLSPAVQESIARRCQDLEQELGGSK